MAILAEDSTYAAFTGSREHGVQVASPYANPGGLGSPLTAVNGGNQFGLEIQVEENVPFVFTAIHAKKGAPQTATALLKLPQGPEIRIEKHVQPKVGGCYTQKGQAPDSALIRTPLGETFQGGWIVPPNSHVWFFWNPSASAEFSIANSNGLLASSADALGTIRTYLHVDEETQVEIRASGDPSSPLQGFLHFPVD